MTTLFRSRTTLGVRRLVALLALGAAACSADSGTSPGAGGTVSVVRLNPASSELGLGGTLQLELVALDAQDNEVAGRPVVWASADTAVATVSQTGLVTARRIGVVQLQAATEGKSAFSVINVVATRVANVRVTPTSANIVAGGSLQLTATTTDAAGAELAGRLVFWQSSNNAVALVTSTGLVNGRAAGTATITATSEGQNTSAQVTITGVTPPPVGGGGSTTPAPVDSVKVVPADTSMARNTTARFRARVFAGNQLVTNRTVIWSTSTPTLLTVNAATGEVTTENRPNSAGLVNATVEGVVGSATVKITSKAASQIRVSPARPTLQVGESMTVSASVVDVDNVALTTNGVTWRSGDPSVLSVTSTGLTTARVTAEKAGTTTIAATVDGVSGDTSITVTAPPAPVRSTTSVGVTPTTASLVAGNTQQLSAIPRDKDGVAREGRSISWRSDAPDNATVSGTGLVTAIRAGTATITATADGVEGSAVITVTAPPAPPPTTTRVVVSAPAGPLLPGQTAQLTATAFDGTTPRTGRSFAWTSSNGAVATVNGTTGLVTAVSPGTATITAADGNVTGSTTVTVNAPPPVPIARVDVTPTTSTLDIGQTAPLTATPRDAAGGPLSGRAPATWVSSNAAVARVDAAGVVTAVAAGTATITATIEGASGTATVTVNPPPVVTVRVDVAPPTATILVGATQPFAATAIDGAGAVRPGRSFVWTTSNAAVATVDAATGVATGVGAGTAAITAADGSVTGTAALTVTVPPPTTTRVEVSAPAGPLLPGQTAQLTATAFDGTTPRTGRSFVWTSSNGAVATVNGTTGLVTAVGPGTATITAADGSVTGSTSVTVNSPPPSAGTATVEVTPASATVSVGATRTLTAVARNPGGVVRPNRVFTWQSSAPGVATVSATGVVTGVAAGTATITATTDGVSGTAAITVFVPAPARIARVLLEPAAVLLYEDASPAAGREAAITAQLLSDADAPLTGRTCEWSGGRRPDGRGQPIVTITPTGPTGVRIRAMDSGATLVTATCEGTSGSAAVTVLAGDGGDDD